MQSESARMSSAAEAKFRINRPNSQPRAVKVIALDAPSERVVKELAGSQWQRASFLTASSFSGAPRQGERFSMGGWLNDLAGRTKDLVDEVNTADLVVVVATAGESAAAAAIIGEACAVKHVMTTALILGGGSTSVETLSKMLAQLRPHVMMLVISSADEYIKDMLTALRA
jgi:tRNA A37 threonylcarbamoyltransferase TsaD